MKQISINRLFLTGLTAYLRGLELSVDRALTQDIGVLKHYCESAIVPTLRQVLGKLYSMCTPVAIDIPRHDNAPCFNGHVLTFIAWLGWYIRGSVFFKESEVRLIHSILFQLSTELAKCQTVDPNVFVPIRLRLSEASSFCRARIPDRGVRRKIDHVEHLNQNARLKTETIDSICDHRDWLN